MNNKIKRIFSILIAFAMLLSLAVVSHAEETTEYDYVSEDDIGYESDSIEGEPEFVCESGNIAMYADMISGKFYILDKQSGEKWYSSIPSVENDEYTMGTARDNVRSEVIINYIYTEDALGSDTSESVNSYSDSVSNGMVDVERLDNGIKVKYNFNFLETTVPVEYILEDGILSVSLKYNEITQSDEFMLTGINILPYFGAADQSETGYMFVPDGSGAIINFNAASTDEGYEKAIYTDSPVAFNDKIQYTQTESIYFPVFGMVKNHGAVLGIVTSNAENSSILAAAKNSICAYNNIYARWNVMTNYTEMMFDTTFGNKRQLNDWTQIISDDAVYSLEYRFISKDEASYVGLAKEYRKYLSENDMLPKSEKLSTPSFNVNLYGAVDTTGNFLGFSYNKKKALTTYAQAKKIITALGNAGIDSISARYIGWSNDGVVNKKLPTKQKTVGCLGGKKQLNELLALDGKNNISITLDVDFVYSTNSKRRESIRNPYNNLIYQYSFYRSVFSRRNDRSALLLANPATIKKVSSKFISSMKDNLDLSFGNLGTLCYSDLSPKNTVLKSEAKEILLDVFENAEEKGVTLTLEGANDYVLQYADKITSAPSSSSRYDLFDKDVPFYQLVLHGSVAMAMEPVLQSANPQVLLLKAAETGMELTYAGIYAHASELFETEYDDLYSSTYTWWLDEAAEFYAQYQPVLEKIYDHEIVDHEEIATGVVRTTYDNGINVTVNYNSYDVNIDNTVVSSMNFVVGGVK